MPIDLKEALSNDSNSKKSSQEGCAEKSSSEESSQEGRSEESSKESSQEGSSEESSQEGRSEESSKESSKEGRSKEIRNRFWFQILLNASACGEAAAADVFIVNSLNFSFVQEEMICCCE